MKRLLSIAAIFLIISIVLCGCSEKAEELKPTQGFYVNDYADVLTDESENDILSMAVELKSQTTAQVVVLTVESLGGEDIASYATEIGREWGIGDKEKNNGVLLLFSEGDREIFIAVGYGLEGALPDSKTGRIIDVYGLDYLKQNDFSEGITAITKAVIGEVYLEYGLTPPNGYASIESITEAPFDGEGGSVFGLWLAVLIFAIVFSFIFRGRGGLLFLLGSSNFRGPRGGGFSGGSFGGGGFRGGGGSFGGGGAGRSF